AYVCAVIRAGAGEPGNQGWRAGATPAAGLISDSCAPRASRSSRKRSTWASSSARRRSTSCGLAARSAASRKSAIAFASCAISASGSGALTRRWRRRLSTPASRSRSAIAAIARNGFFRNGGQPTTAPAASAVVDAQPRAERSGPATRPNASASSRLSCSILASSACLSAWVVLVIVAPGGGGIQAYLACEFGKGRRSGHVALGYEQRNQRHQQPGAGNQPGGQRTVFGVPETDDRCDRQKRQGAQRAEQQRHAADQRRHQRRSVQRQFDTRKFKVIAAALDHEFRNLAQTPQSF